MGWGYSLEPCLNECSGDPAPLHPRRPTLRLLGRGKLGPGREPNPQLGPRPGRDGRALESRR